MKLIVVIKFVFKLSNSGINKKKLTEKCFFLIISKYVMLVNTNNDLILLGDIGYKDHTMRLCSIKKNKFSKILLFLIFSFNILIGLSLSLFTRQDSLHSNWFSSQLSNGGLNVAKLEPLLPDMNTLKSLPSWGKRNPQDKHQLSTKAKTWIIIHSNI